MPEPDSARQDLARTLEEHAEPLAAAAVTAMEAGDPSLLVRYGAEGMRKCAEDTVFHIQHLAAALDVDDPGELHRYRQWLSTVLGTRGVPEADVDACFAALAAALTRRYGAAAAPAVRFLESCLPRHPG
jgi:hypothetical protein